MELRQLGNSDLEITPLGIGAWAMGGPGYAFAWGEQDDSESIEAIHRALDLGFNWIDTAAVYGLGHSEEIVAKALDGIANRPYVFTKCERTWDESGKITGRLKADSIRKECEDSLRRLKVDIIDLYQVHWPDPEGDIEEGWTTMNALKKEGKVKNIGVSNFNVNQLKRAQEIAPITSLQPPYNLIRRDIESDILPFCKENNIGVIVYSPMASGLLTGKMTKERAESLSENDWRSRSESFKEPALSKNLAIAEKLGAIGSKHGKNAAETALAWTLHHSAVTAAIVGMRNPGQAEGVAGALGFRLSDGEAEELQDMAAH